MNRSDNNSPRVSGKQLGSRSERGAALATAILMMALLSAIAMTVLAVVAGESRVAGGDLKRTQTFYAAASAIEKMSSDFSALYGRTSRPTQSQYDAIALSYPSELVAEGFSFTNPPQTVGQDANALAAMRTTQGIVAPALPRVTMPANSPFGGLIASVNPFVLTSTATAADGTQVALTRNMNNYLIPLFQFGMFSDDDIELHPGATFTFNGRVHANGNVYVAGLVKFLDKVTSAHEILYDTMRNGAARGSASTVSMGVGAFNVPLTKGSLSGGPNIVGQASDQPNYFPGSPNGTVWNPGIFVWQTTSKQAADGAENKFGGQLLTRVTGAAPLRLPMELDGNPTREIIKRRLPTDSLPPPVDTSPLTDSRYHSKAEIRILIDDEGVTNDAAGLYGTQNGDGVNSHDGVNLSTFNPMMLPNATVAASGGRALWRILDNNTAVGNSYNEVTAGTPTFPRQQQGTTPVQADTVRGIRAPAYKTITATTKTNGNLITITSNGHGFLTGDRVLISGVVNTSGPTANGQWLIAVLDANRFTLNGTSSGGAGSYTVAAATVLKLETSANGTVIPYGAGLSGHILIQIVAANGSWRDVTREVLSMGMTVGEPNAIVQLQRPLWAAFTQGSRDGSTTSTTPNTGINGDSNYSNCLTDIVNRTHIAADGEVNTGVTLQDPAGYLTGIVDDTASGAQPLRSDVPPALNTGAFASTMWNSIVPINVYNVREGRLSTTGTSPTSDANQVYERGITSLVEINMKNLSRWVDGVYDLNLLAGTPAISANIANPDGYVVYISDRRGDNVKNLVVPVAGSNPVAFQNINSTNGMADNVDIYGPNGVMDGGEDVQNTGVAIGNALVKDTAELPDPAALAGTSNATDFTSRRNRAIAVAAWSNPSNYFRRAVRLFNAETLQTIGAPRATLTTILGMTISSENMVYTWGNYNTTGINQAPAAGFANLNDPAVAARYNGNQVPASIVVDAWFPLSKTWSDSLSSIYPDTLASRPADRVASGTIAVTDETSVRTGIIAGNNLGALAGLPDGGNNGAPSESRLNGGMHNFPRFLESWTTRFNFVGALIPLYRSTQALGPYNANSTIYGAPIRNWAFDVTFTNPARLPPGTPQFQHVEPTGFRQIF